MELFGGITLNQQGDPEPNGTRENTALKAIISGIMADTLDYPSLPVTGHRHGIVYNGYGQPIIQANNTDSQMKIGVQTGQYSDVHW